MRHDVEGHISRLLTRSVQQRYDTAQLEKDLETSLSGEVVDDDDRVASEARTLRGSLHSTLGLLDGILQSWSERGNPVRSRISRLSARSSGVLGELPFDVRSFLECCSVPDTLPRAWLLYFCVPAWPWVSPCPASVITRVMTGADVPVHRVGDCPPPKGLCDADRARLALRCVYEAEDADTVAEAMSLATPGAGYWCEQAGRLVRALDGGHAVGWTRPDAAALANELDADLLVYFGVLWSVFSGPPSRDEGVLLRRLSDALPLYSRTLRHPASCIPGFDPGPVLFASAVATAVALWRARTAVPVDADDK